MSHVANFMNMIDFDFDEVEFCDIYNSKFLISNSRNIPHNYVVFRKGGWHVAFLWR